MLKELNRNKRPFFAVKNKKKVILLSIGGFLGLVLLIQFLYPYNKTALYTKISGVDYSGWNIDDASKDLNKRYSESLVNLFFSENQESYANIPAKDLGYSFNIDEIVDSKKYQLWQRFIPGSILWVGLTNQNQNIQTTDNKTKISDYVNKTFGDDCFVQPKNANLEVKNQKIKVVKSQLGGKCQKSEVIKSLSDVEVDIESENNLRLPVEGIEPVISTNVAEKFLLNIEQKTSDDLSLRYQDQVFGIDKNQLISWLEFDNSGESIQPKINLEKSSEFYQKDLAEKVKVEPGVSKVTTRDLLEISRVNGANGQSLDIEKTNQSLSDFLSGNIDQALVEVKSVEPKVEYTRTYSQTDAGLSASLKHLAEDKKGVYGIAVMEMGGARRNASFNGDRKFTTASTYKLYVAYSVLKRLDSGQMNWSSLSYGGKTVEKCLDDMIVLSDNPCAEWFVQKIGYRTLNNEASGLGMRQTSFVDIESYKTSASDLVKFVSILEARQLSGVSRSSQDKLISMMSRNVYRQGIPAGSNGKVADKVGFLDGFLHDAGIVYLPGKTYAIAVMTDGSSWANIADITRKVEEILK